MFKSNFAQALGLTLALSSCSIGNEYGNNAQGTSNAITFAIKGYSLVHATWPSIDFLDDEDSKAEYNRVKVNAVINGEEIVLSCPVRERCKNVFNMSVDHQKFLESQFFGCVDWEKGCKKD